MQTVETVNNADEPARNSAETVNQLVMQSLESGDFNQATRLIDLALERWPENVRLQLTKGDVLRMAEGGVAAALYYIGLLDGRPAHPWALGRLGPILSETEFAPADSAAIIDALVAAKLDAAAQPTLFDPLLKSLTPDHQLATLRAIAPNSGSFRLEWKLAVAETERGDVAAALDILTKARNEGRSNEAATTLLSELLATCSRLPEAIQLLTQAMEDGPDRPDPQRRLINILQRAGEFKQAGELMERAIARWPNDWMLLFRLNRLPIEPAWLKSIFDKIASTADAAAQRDERFRMQFVLACLHVGEIERAYRLLQHPFSKPVAHMALPLIKALDARPIEFWRNSRLNDNRSLDVQIACGERARVTIVVPIGVTFGYLPPAMIDALFAQHDVNVIYLRDFRKRSYLRGVMGLGRDEAETLNALKRIISDLGAPRMATMGASMGGFVAMRYGALLDAFAAVSFAGPTELISFYQGSKATIWNPSHFIKLTLQRESELPCDLIPVLRSSGANTRFFQFYGDGAADDAWQAKRLQGLPNVAVMPVCGVADHIMVDHMIADGSFDALLQRLAA